MTLTGILKNILLVIISVMIWHTTINWMQFLGYAIALAGLVYYSLGYDQLAAISAAVYVYARGVFRDYTALPSSSGAAAASDDQQPPTGRLTSAVRRALITGVAMLVVIFLVVQFLYADQAPVVPPVSAS